VPCQGRSRALPGPPGEEKIGLANAVREHRLNPIRELSEIRPACHSRCDHQRRSISSSASGPGARTPRNAGRRLKRTTTTWSIWLTRFGTSASGRPENLTAPSPSPTGRRSYTNGVVCRSYIAARPERERSHNLHQRTLFPAHCYGSKGNAD